MEYQKHIDFYKEYWLSDYSDLISCKNWGDTDAAKKYLEKYWLSKQEYLDIWKSLQDQIFKNNSEVVFQPNFKVIALRGGFVFIEESFNIFRKTLLEIGEDYFVIIEDPQDLIDGEPTFRMKYPSSITWNELMSGNYISSVIFEMPHNNYFIFGTKDNWGKFSANDYLLPVDIMGFKSELDTIFEANFIQNREEYDEILEWLPEAYKSIIYTPNDDL